jgi:hypothetical protein
VAGGEERRETSSDDQACGGRKEAARPFTSTATQVGGLDVHSKKWFGWVGFRVCVGGLNRNSKSVLRREFRDSTPVTSLLGSWAEPTFIPVFQAIPVVEGLLECSRPSRCRLRCLRRSEMVEVRRWFILYR